MNVNPFKAATGGSREFEERYSDGDLIVREGDTARHMYVIQAGKVRITKRIGGEEVVLATLDKGDFFGEMSLLESLPRDANARAVGPTELLVINPGGLLVRIRRDPTFAFEMLHRLSGRIRGLNKRLVALVEAQGQVNREAQAEDASLMYAAHDDGAGRDPAFATDAEEDD